MGPRISLLFGIAGAALALLAGSEASAKSCTKINNGLNICDVLANTCQSAMGTPGCQSNGQESPAGCVPTFGQERFYNQQRYTDPPGNGVTAQAAYQNACEKWWRWEKIFVGTWPNGYGGPVQAVLLQGGGAECKINYDWPNKGPMVSAGVIGTDTFPTEPECNRTPNGPYRTIAPDWRGNGDGTTSRGKPFHVEDRWYVASELSPGLPGNNFLRFSDAVRAGANESWPAFEALGVACPRYANDVDPIDYPDPIVPPGNLERLKCFEADHLIPKKDIHGCDCGDNSPGNLILISRELNEGMSNDMSHPDRQLLLQYYTLP